MFDIITSIVNIIIQNVIPLLTRRKPISATNTLYLLYISLNIIIDKSEEVNAYIATINDPKKASLINDISNNILQIYRQTNIFINSSSYIIGKNGLLAIYEEQLEKTLRSAYGYDIYLLSALTSMIETLRLYFIENKEILDFNPESYPDSIYWLAQIRYIRRKVKETGINVIEITNKRQLGELYESTNEQIKKLKSCSMLLSKFIKKNCTINDFVDLKKNDSISWCNSWKFVELDNYSLTLEKKLRKKISLLEEKIESITKKPIEETYGHEFSSNGVCKKCQLSKDYVKFFGRECK